MPFSSLSEFIKYGKIPEAAMDGREEKALSFLDSAYEEMAGYFRAATPPIVLPLPASSISTMMKKVECWLAAWDMIGDIGFDPTSRSDEVYRLSRDDGIAWLKGVASGSIQPLPVSPDGDPVDGNTDPSSNDSGAAVVSDPPRNWSALAR